MDPPRVEKALMELCETGRDLWVPSEVVHMGVEGVKEDLLGFYRRHVSMSTPAIIHGVPETWKAMSQWRTNEGLIKCMGDTPVPVQVTPNGRADAVEGDRFVLPEELEVGFEEGLRRVVSSRIGTECVYMSAQNDCLRTSYKGLLDGVDMESMAWAEELFGAPPDAMNVWLGPQSAVSSIHADPYENIMVVLRGKKIFHLFPPTEGPLLPRRTLKAARWTRGDGGWEIREEPAEPERPWITWDPDTAPDTLKNHAFKPLRVEVNAGEALYLPSGWFHRVSQQGELTVAVNFWYDQLYGPLYAWRALGEALGSTK